MKACSVSDCNMDSMMGLARKNATSFRSLRELIPDRAEQLKVVLCCFLLPSRYLLGSYSTVQIGPSCFGLTI